MTCARSSSAHRSSDILRTARNGADSRHSGICPGDWLVAATARCSSGTVDRDRPVLSSVQAERRPYLSEPTRGGFPYSPHPRNEETSCMVTVGHRQQGLGHAWVDVGLLFVAEVIEREVRVPIEEPFDLLLVLLWGDRAV